MDAHDVLKLVNAGFTKDEIMALSAPKTEVTPDPEVTPAPEVNVVETKEPEVKKNSDSSSVDALIDKVADLEKLIQAQNRQNVVFETPKQEQTDDIFKQVFGLELDTSNREE